MIYLQVKQAECLPFNWGEAKWAISYGEGS